MKIAAEPIKSCALSGHRELNKDFDERNLKETLLSLLEEGVEVFYNGLAVGFDLLSAELLCSLKNEYPTLKIIGCVPYYGQEKYYPQKDKQRYLSLIKQLDEVIVLADSYYRGCLLRRNEYMCQHADMLLAYCKKKTGGTAYTLKYCKKLGKRTVEL